MKRETTLRGTSQVHHPSFSQRNARRCHPERARAHARERRTCLSTLLRRRTFPPWTLKGILRPWASASRSFAPAALRMTRALALGDNEERDHAPGHFPGSPSLFFPAKRPALSS